MVGLPNSDRLSELHDSLIYHILSFLPMKDVVSTTVISKRWKNLWTRIPCLNFLQTFYAYADEPDRSSQVRDFINRALLFWRGSKIRKFKINFHPKFYRTFSDDIDLWVLLAKENELEELDIHIEYFDVDFGDASIYCAPQCIFSCCSLKKLSLVGCELQLNGSVHWNQLKSLHIDSFQLGEDVINHALSGCPQLEDFELYLHYMNNNLNIQSTSLKILKVEVFDYDPKTDLELRITCPNLGILNIPGDFLGKCLLMNMPLLKDFTLGYTCFYTDKVSIEKTFRHTVRQIFRVIQDVKRVTLSSSSSYMLQVMDRKYLPLPLQSVESLELQLHYGDLNKIVNILGIFPKLKLLVVLHHYTRYHITEVPLKFVTNLSKSFLLTLRKVEITSCLRGNFIFQFVEFLLEDASMLEKMVIRQDSMPHSPESLLLVTEKLLSIPRSSPTAKVIFCRK